MKMKDSREFKEWQRDLIFLAHHYKISSTYDKNESADVFTQILQAADSVPEELEKMLGRQTSESMQRFFKTTAGSLLELYNLLKMALNLNLISIDEYHSLSNSLSEISRIIKTLLKNVNFNQKDSEKKMEQKPEDAAFWLLN